MKIDRRKFIKHSAKVTAVSGVATTLPFNLFSSGRTKPNDTVNIGLIGCKSRGFHVLEQHLKLSNVHCSAVCDVDEQLMVEKVAAIEEKYGQKAKIYKDYRKMLEDKEIDAVIIGTPDHWHCLQTIHACQAEKDVYVEKPMANSIEECNLMVNAARKYARVVQVGQQQRSSPVWKEVMDYIGTGKLGKLRRVNIWANFNYAVGALKTPDTTVPKGVDYDMWLGPASKVPFNLARFHSSWRFFWDYGGGLMTDWGVHLIDMAMWAGNLKGGPKTTLAYGDNLSYPERAREAYDTMSVIYPNEDYIIQWEHTAGVQVGPYKHLYGITFKGDNGTIFAHRGGWELNPEWDNDKKAFKIEKIDFKKGKNGHSLHAVNFIDCIKSRKDPVCTVETGRDVALYAHIANIAVRTGSYKLQWDDTDNKFINAKEANKYVKPNYRKPWELPKTV
ncbi:MAG: Gfo/Idh/MocA family oxidoreductase [Bacteroidota bacterium]